MTKVGRNAQKKKFDPSGVLYAWSSGNLFNNYLKAQMFESVNKDHDTFRTHKIVIVRKFAAMSQDMKIENNLFFLFL